MPAIELEVVCSGWRTPLSGTAEESTDGLEALLEGCENPVPVIAGGADADTDGDGCMDTGHELEADAEDTGRAGATVAELCREVIGAAGDRVDGLSCVVSGTAIVTGIELVCNAATALGGLLC